MIAIINQDTLASLSMDAYRETRTGIPISKQHYETAHWKSKLSELVPISGPHTYGSGLYKIKEHFQSRCKKFGIKKLSSGNIRESYKIGVPLLLFSSIPQRTFEVLIRDFRRAKCATRTPRQMAKN
jgi:hypothetical protein